MSAGRSDRALPLLGFSLPILAGGNFFLFLDPEPAFAMFTAIVMGFALLWVVGRAPHAITATIELSALAIFTMVWVAQFACRASGATAATTTRTLLLAAVAFVVLRRRPLSLKEARVFFTAVVLGTVVTVAYGQYQYWEIFPRIAPVIRASGYEPLGAVNANFYSPNCYAPFLAAIAILALSLVVDGTTLQRWIAFCSLPPILATLWLTGSRATLALFAATTGIGVLVARHRSVLRSRLSRVAIPGIGLALLAAACFGDLIQVGALGRLRIWGATSRMIADHFFLGIGIGRFAEAFPKYQLDSYYTRYPHNFWLEIFAESGVIAVIALSVFLIASVSSVILGATAERRSEKIQPYRYGAAAAAVLMIVHALLDIDWHAPANPILFFMLLAIAAASKPAANASTGDVAA